jgi:hypothetical protein
MLLAHDIDGTTATAGNWSAHGLATNAGIAIPQAARAGKRSGCARRDGPQVPVRRWRRRADLAAGASARHQDMGVPLPSAGETLPCCRVATAISISLTDKRPAARTSRRRLRHLFCARHLVLLHLHPGWKAIPAFRPRSTSKNQWLLSLVPRPGSGAPVSLAR